MIAWIFSSRNTPGRGFENVLVQLKPKVIQWIGAVIGIGDHHVADNGGVHLVEGGQYE